MIDEYSSCHLCPRQCGVDRHKSLGFCRESATPRLAWCGLHRGEEEIVSGENGSGMFFFTGCTLGCQYCQNYQISTSNTEFNSFIELDIDIALKLCAELKSMGAHTISLITAEHFNPFIVELLKKLKQDHFPLPIVYNTSGFISIETIASLIEYVDIWLWDVKTHSVSVAKEYCGTINYPQIEKKGLEYLYSNTKDQQIILRHLVIPSNPQASIECINDVEKYTDRCIFSLMGQFIDPANPKTGKRVQGDEYDKIQKALFSTCIENGYIQELGNESQWLPDFNRPNPFAPGFATPAQLFLDLRCTHEMTQ